MENAFYKAFTGTDYDLVAYLNATTSFQMQADFRQLIRELNEAGTITLTTREDGYSEMLQELTKAAMQGLLAHQGRVTQMGSGELRAFFSIEAVASIAVNVARATLSEISKQQQP